MKQASLIALITAAANYLAAVIAYVAPADFPSPEPLIAALVAFVISYLGLQTEAGKRMLK